MPGPFFGRTHKSLTRLMALLMSTTAPLARVEAQNAGHVGAVNPASTGTPPGATQRTLVIGTNVVHKERVETSASGSAQIVFPDTSTLNVGRNSSIVIDEYVYDPNAGAGSMAASLTKGVMRFVGGQISHTAGITVNTPTGTLGVRGGSVTVLYPIPANIAASDPALAGCHGELIIGHVGVATLTNNAGSATIRPGLAACVNSANDVIIVFPISSLTFNLVLALLTPSSDSHGGAIDLPTDRMTQQQGMGGSIVSDPTHPPGSDPLGFVNIIGGGDALSANKAHSSQTHQVSPPPPAASPPPPTLSPPPANVQSPPPGRTTSPPPASPPPPPPLPPPPPPPPPPLPPPPPPPLPPPPPPPPPPILF